MHQITKGWHFIRVVRLLMGVAAMVQAVWLQEWLLAILGGFIAAMAIFNQSCCGQSCATNSSNNFTQPFKKNVPITYEEVVIKP